MDFGESLPPPSSGPPRILVVDDDDGRRTMYAKVLRFEGYEVACLDHGNGVLDYVREHRPDLIILDVMLPGRCGFEICGDLRMLDEARLTPVILVTAAETDESSVVRGLLCGADDYIVNPHLLGELKARVRVQLRNRRDRELLRWARQQRASFREAAFIDSLTGISNRRAGDDAIAAALDSGAPATLLLFDVDHFKRVNDGCGHAVGDKVLRTVAQTVDGLARKGDVVARFGGEEFMVLIKGASPTIARRVGERFRRGVAAIAFEPTLEVGRITVSIGIATWGGGRLPPSREGFVQKADEALYRAKNAGRNRVAVNHFAPPATGEERVA